MDRQDGSISSPPACECGTVALGRCADCNRLLCRNHSVIWEDLLVCGEDLSARRKAKAEKAQDSFELALQEHDAESRHAVSAFLAAASAIKGACAVSVGEVSDW